MVSNNALKMHQSPSGARASGCWSLAPAQALTLHPNEAGVLRVAQGRVWATLAGPHHGPANDWGDVVLGGGEQMALMPGQQVVVEPFGDAVNAPAYFCWEPLAAHAPAAPQPPSLWGDALARPSLDVAPVPAFPIAAIGRLLGRVAAALTLFVAGKGRVLSPLESNQP